MIRIRPGNFVYLEEEVDAMIQDIHQFKDIDADGFVFGALTLGGDVNVEACEKVKGIIFINEKGTINAKFNIGTKIFANKDKN